MRSRRPRTRPRPTSTRSSRAPRKSWPQPPHRLLSSNTVALLVAAGSGSRLGAEVPKAFVEVAGRPMIEWSLAALRAAGIEEIVVALPAGVGAPSGCVGVRGGATRSESVRAALGACGPGDVVVHDAARPLVAPELFARCVAALADADCAIAAARVTDTVKEAEGD